MLIVEIDGVDYKIPTTYNEINIKKYKQLIKVDKDLDELNKVRKYLSIILEIEEDKVRTINRKVLEKIISKTSFLNDKVDNYKFKRIIKINGVKYGFIPDFTDLIYGEWEDLMELNKDTNTINNNFDTIMGILYRPIIKMKKEKWYKIFLFRKRMYKSYEIIDYIDYKNSDFNKNVKIFNLYMGLDIALGAFFFFINLKMKYLNNSVGGLEEKLKKMKGI